MFQLELGYLMREERHKDFVREAEHARRQASRAQPQRIFRIARALLSAPLAVILFIARAIALRLSL
jgi:hypothetical protein